jgi:DNA replication protein DnaC
MDQVKRKTPPFRKRKKLKGLKKKEIKSLWWEGQEREDWDEWQFYKIIKSKLEELNQCN